MEREIEQQMEKFDMLERKKSAQVMNELSKIVITAWFNNFIKIKEASDLFCSASQPEWRMRK